MIENTYSELRIGDMACIEKTVTETDVYLYAGITGDFSWLHVNEIRAQQGHFKTRIVHGMLLIGLISTVIGNYLPGAGTVYESQDITFLKPCYINDTIKAQTEVLERMDKGRVKLRTICFNQNDSIVLDGQAIVIPPRHHVLRHPVKVG